MEEWKEYKLKEICEVINGRAYKQEELLDGGKYRVLRVGNIFQGNNWYYSDMELPEDKYCNKGDLLYAWSCGFAPYIWEGEKTIYHYHIWKLVENQNIVNRIFLYYYLIENTKRFLGGTHGSVMLHLTKREMEEQTVKLPSLSIQQHIASILKSLDDKIEVNRRINDNLEQQAQALFKSWFVDFEPFKDGEFVESELGMIPKGWRVGKLGKLCTFKRGKNLLKKDAIDGGVPVVAGGLEPSCYHNVSNTKSPVVTVSGSGANAGFMRMYYQEVWASDCSFIDSTCDNLLFVYCFLSVNNRLLRHAQTGAVQPHVKPSDIHDFDIVIPTKDIIEEFQKKIEETIKLRGNIEKENIRLASLRDTLLPKLMSGELKVNEVEMYNQ